MLINLTKSVLLKELCRITAFGFTQDIAQQIEFTFSHEAMIGFATELLWMYEDIDENDRSVMCTHQLQVNPAPTQAVGFYLTSDSPELTLKINSLTEKIEDGDLYENWKEINIRSKNEELYFNVKNPTAEDIEFITLEAYELDRKNIVRIKVLDEEGNDITKGYRTVVWEINRDGMKDLATMLLVWADNYREGCAYALPQMDNPKQGYNLGILLTRDSIPCKFKAHDLGVANDYDSRF